MTFQFNDFELDTAAYQLRRAGRQVRLERMPMELLFLLVKRAGALVPRHEIQAALWGEDVFVEAEPAINTVIRKVRQALGDDADQPRFIETVVGKGYRFVAPVIEKAATTTGDPAPTRGRSLGDERRWRPQSRWVAATGVVAVLAASLAVFTAIRWTKRSGEAAPSPIRSIAVLPFDNLSQNPGQDDFTEAISEELTTRLATVSSLNVLSHVSTAQINASNRSVPALAQMLHVDGVVQGTVRRDGDHIRVTAQLSHVASGRKIWADSYDRDLRDVLTLQREMARTIAEKVRVTLTPGERTRLTAKSPINPDAYLAYVKGRYFWNQRTESALHNGIASFSAALDREPSYADAYAGIADCYTALGYGSYLPPKIAFEKAKVAAQQAIALKSDLADAHASLGYVDLYYDWNFSGAEREFRDALLLNPNSVTAHDWFAVYLTAMERFDEAQAEISRAQALDPLALPINTDVGFVSYYSGRYDAAAKQLRLTLEMGPRFPLAHLWLGRTYQEQQDFDGAMREYAAAAEVVGDWPVTMAAIGNVEGISGNRREARQVLERLVALKGQKYVTPYGLGLVYAALGDDDLAFDALREAIADRSNWLVWLKLDMRWGRLRRDARFGELLRQVHLPS
jgi:TolB-like protein/DNA-binding winged helix-turn-helix (wHTH) protein/Flp pilus assembly protein TadD